MFVMSGASPRSLGAQPTDDKDSMVMGDLILMEDEINPVIESQTRS